MPMIFVLACAVVLFTANHAYAAYQCAGRCSMTDCDTGRTCAAGTMNCDGYGDCSDTNDGGAYCRSLGCTPPANHNYNYHQPVYTPTYSTLTAICSGSYTISGNTVNFTATASGGDGSYTYSWSGACSGSGVSCSNVYNPQGPQNATVLVASGSQTATATCLIPASHTCTPYSQQRCIGTQMFWYDSCGNQGIYIGLCTQCIRNYQQRCMGSQMYWYDSCGNQGTYIGNCGSTCIPNYQQRCLGNQLYWYYSCGGQGMFIQNCPGGCNGNTCQTNYNYNNNSCTYHAYKLCSGNNIYWYDSCGNKQDLYTSCASGQTCSAGQCISNNQNNNYTVYYRTACYNNSVYWYDSLGAVSGLNKSCSDNNSCTVDTCSASKCSNTLKCDGSTCAVSTTDYNTYCASNHCGNGSCEANLGETNANCSNDCKTATVGLTLSFLTKSDSNSTQWQKTAQIGPSGQVYFLISVTNSSTSQADNVVVSANIPNQVASLGNLKLDGTTLSGDIVSGINIGSVGPSTTKSITFEGRTQDISTASTGQAVATTNVSGTTQTDSLSIDFTAQTAAAVSEAPATSGFGAWLKHWYLWILGAIVLIFLFVVVFRRFSSEEA